MNERDGDRFGAVWVYLTVAHHFEAVDGERGAPMRQIAADLRNVGGKAWRIKLQLEERRPGSAGGVLIAVWNTSAFGIRFGIVECHRQLESDEVSQKTVSPAAAARAAM